MPSRFEPCRIAQMYAQAYGALPIVRRTRGLASTLEDGATGFSLRRERFDGLRGREPPVARHLRPEKAPPRDAPQRLAMASRCGWDGAAQSYAALYNRTIGNDATRCWKAA